MRCAAMRSNPNRETIPACPECKRTNAPFEKDHPFGIKLQAFFRVEKLVREICINFHKVKSKREDPLMKFQAEILPDSHCGDDKTLAEVVMAGLLGVTTALSALNDQRRSATSRRTTGFTLRAARENEE